MYNIVDNIYISSLEGTREFLQMEYNNEPIAIVSIGDFGNPHWTTKFSNNIASLHLGAQADGDARRFRENLPIGVEFIHKNQDKGKER